MADYSGHGPVGNGEGTTGQFYQEIKWSGGKFYIKNDSGYEIEQEVITNSDHRQPNYTVDFKLDENKLLTATFTRTKNDDGTQPRSGDFFCYRVGIEAWDEAHENDIISVTCTGDPNWNGNWAWGGSYGIGEDQATTIDLSGLQFPIFVRAVCAGCNSQKNTVYLKGFAHYWNSNKYGPDDCYGGGAYKILQGHTHIINPKPPVIIKTSGTTITVNCDQSDDSSHKGYIKDETNNGSWNEIIDTTNGYIFTNYNYQTLMRHYGKNITYRAARYCDDKCTNDNKLVESDTTTIGTTWGMEARSTPINRSTSSLKFSIKHIPGTNGGTAESTDLICRLYKVLDHRTIDLNNNMNTTNQEITFIEKNVDPNTWTVEFTGLDENTNYYGVAWSDCVCNETIRINSNPKLDNIICFGGKTLSGTTFTHATSATTAKITSQWNNFYSGAYCEITLSYISDYYNNIGSAVWSAKKTITTNGGFVVFTDLDPMTIYNMNYVIKDNNGNTYEEVDEKIYTKGVNITVLKTSPRAVIFRCDSSNPNIQARILEYSDVWNTYDINTDIKYYNILDHNKNYTIQAMIPECYAYNIDGTISSTNDSITNSVFETCKLCVMIGDTIHRYQNCIACNLETYVDIPPTGNNQYHEMLYCTRDPISKDNYYILDSIVKPIYRIGFLNPPSTAEFNVSPPPYQYYVNELSILYIPVPYYYCYYEITVRISDGHNIASTTFEACTEFPYSSIYHTGGWHGVIPYIYHAGSWVKAVAYMNDGSNWCEPDSSAW